MIEKKVRLTLLEPMLGTVSGNEEIYKDYIGAKHPDGVTPDDEVQGVAEIGADEVMQKASTFFMRTSDKQLFIFDYLIKGFFKEACGALRRVKDSPESKFKAYKKEIDGLIFINPRQIIIDTKGEKPGWVERPLRASTPQGERVALARSESVPAGSTMDVSISLLSGKLESFVETWLDYGKFKGLGQWRNSGMGKFSWEEI